MDPYNIITVGLPDLTNALLSLHKEVNKEVAKGWLPQGGVAVCSTGMGYVVAQALFKAPKERKVIEE